MLPASKLCGRACVRLDVVQLGNSLAFSLLEFTLKLPRISYSAKVISRDPFCGFELKAYRFLAVQEPLLLLGKQFGFLSIVQK